jgi:hypothetical protein
MTNCPDRSATVRSWNSPLRNSSTIAPGVAVPAMTASPDRSMRAMSKAGKDSSVSGARGGTASAAAAAVASACTVASADEPLSGGPDAGGEISGAAVAALVSTGGSGHTCMMPKPSAAPHAATSASDGTTIRAIDVAVMICAPLARIVGSSAPRGVTLRRFVMAFKSAKRVSRRSVVLTNAPWHETDVPRRAISESEWDIAKLTGLTRSGPLLLPARFR